MAIAFVQSAKTNTTTKNTTVTFGAGATANNLLVAILSGTAAGPAQNWTSSGWTKATADNYGGGTGGQVEIMYKVAAGGETGVTFASDGTSAWVTSAVMAEYSGIATVSPLDKIANDGTNSASGVTSRGTGTTAATTQAAELAIAAVCQGNTVTALSWTNSFATRDSTAQAGSGVYLADLVLAATGTQTSTASWTTARAAGGCIATFKAAAGGSAPVNTVAPAVTGTTTVGQVLSCTTGTWTTSNPVYTYQWQRDVAGNGSFSDIGSSTSSTYTLVDADDGNKVRCNVKDTDDNGNTTQASNAVGLIVESGVPTISVAPAVTGTTTVGQTLTTDNGTWTHQGGSVHTYTYQWQRDAFGNSVYSNIGSATSTTYVLVDADDACHIQCLVTATNDVGSGSAATSNVVGTVIEPAPTNSVVPALGGTNANVNAAITSTTGTWANMGGHGPTYTYQWKDSATSGGAYSNIASATSSSYTVGAGELGLFLKCFVTAHNTNGSTATANTVASAAAGAAATDPAPKGDSTIPFLLIFSGACD